MKPVAESTPLSPWPRRLALLLALVALPLVFVGGLVTTHEAGMAVPDWPSTYGYNLFLYPWQTWLAGPFDLLVEHGHRLLGALAGLLAIALVCVAWRDRRPWLRWAALAALLAICTQGVLGGLRVRLDSRMLALAHGCFAHAVFAGLALLAAAAGSRTLRGVLPPGSTLPRLAGVTLLLAYLQALLGVCVRHGTNFYAPDVFRTAAWFHLGGSLVVAAHLLWLTAGVLRSGPGRQAAQGPALALAGLLPLQLALGAAAWLANFGPPTFLTRVAWLQQQTIVQHGLTQSLLTTGHVAVGSLLLAATSVCWYRLACDRAPQPRTNPATFTPQPGAIAV